MLVITVARKPLEGTVARNALKWGCGSLNIQGTRIAHGTDVDMEAVQRQSVAPAIDFGGSGLIGKEIMIYKPGGRWPSNLAFCAEVGHTIGEASRFFKVLL